MNSLPYPRTVEILGSRFAVGDLLHITYGNGQQKVRILEITRSGRVKIERWTYANTPLAHWRKSNTAIAANDPRWIVPASCTSP